MGKTEEKIEIILAQWQTCVEMANSISQRRDAMNNIFVTINLAILATLSFSWDIKAIMILVAGTAICILWSLFIRNFKMLNAEKFKVINELEESLPATPFKEEWECLQKNKRYKDGTVLEMILPIMFMILYIIAISVIVILQIN